MILLSTMSFMVSALVSISAGDEIEALPGTESLTTEGDIASQLVSGVDKFLLRELDAAVERRLKHWNRDFSSAENYNASIEPNRKRLAHILGVRDARVLFDGLEKIGTTEQPALVGRGDGYDIYAVRWPAFGDVNGEGLLLEPTNGSPIANIVAIPDADQTPEQIAGLVEGVAAESQYARRLAESGCRVVVPMLINREPKVNQISNREFLYRSAFELGRHLIGYEVQKVLAVVDWFERDAAKIGVIGWGEGALLALYAGVLDIRIDAVCVSGYFDSRQNIWQQPISRNVFGLLEQFGDAELASMIAPRTLIIEAAKAPERVVPPGTGGAAPSTLTTPELDSVGREFQRANELTKDLASQFELVVSGDGSGDYGSAEALDKLLAALSADAKLAELANAPQNLRGDFNPDKRHERQMHEIDRHNQWLLRESPYVRNEFFSIEITEKS